MPHEPTPPDAKERDGLDSFYSGGVPVMERTYSRRRFIGVAGFATGALLLAPVMVQGRESQYTAYVDAFGKKYQGTRDGRVLESVDGGQTWQQVANFGSHCAVQALGNRRDKLQARISVTGYRFVLISADARTWYTV
jgi:hypothetical protein